MYMYLCIMWCVCVLLFTVYNHVKNFMLIFMFFFVACFLFLLCMHGYYHNTRVDFA